MTAQNQQYVGRPAAGVLVANANNIRFERNIFTQMAATGLDLNYGTHDDTIVGNVFTDIGGAGVSLGKFVQDETTEFHLPYNPSDAGEICTNDTIKDNYITNATTEIQGACGIACGFVGFAGDRSQLPTTLSITTPCDGTVAVYWVAMEPRSVWDQRSRTVAEVAVIPRLDQVTLMSALAPVRLNKTTA